MFTLIHGLGALSASTGLTVEDNDGPPVAVTVDGLVVHGGTASSAASPSTSECTDTNDGAATAGAGAELGGDTGAPRSASLPLRRGLRILSMDGGGVRGLMEVEMLRKIEADTGKRVRSPRVAMLVVPLRRGPFSRCGYGRLSAFLPPRSMSCSTSSQAAARVATWRS